jgi:hypothetical protein
MAHIVWDPKVPESQAFSSRPSILFIYDMSVTPSRLHLRLPGGIFLSGFLTEILYAILMRTTHPTSLILVRFIILSL